MDSSDCIAMGMLINELNDQKHFLAQMSNV